MQKQNKTRAISGIIYEGKSILNGGNIVVIALAGKSSNAKTGSMVQTYILNADIDPITANRTGEDYSICGECPHKGIANPEKTQGLADGRSCYVNLGQGARQVFKSYKAGNYPKLTQEQMQVLGFNRMVRLGTYGDPSAAPIGVFNALLSKAIGSTGYTHQNKLLKEVDSRLMVSADNLQAAIEAHANNRRTFRVIPIATYEAQGKAALLKSEILCPASKEMGEKVQCVDCGLCDGTKKGKSIAIVAHGIAKNNVNF